MTLPVTTRPIARKPLPRPEEERSWWRDVGWRKLSQWQVYLLILLPTLLTLAVFNYYPKVYAVGMSLYRWQPGIVQEYTGLSNYRDALADPLFWQSFELVAILLLTNFFKLIPGIIAAVALHRIVSPRWRYTYQVAFVIPMVVPAMVWLLIWKSFYDPDFGLLNRFLNLTGLMEMMAILDGTQERPGLMPQLAELLQPGLDLVINPLFGNVWGLVVCGSILLALRYLPGSGRKRVRSGALLVAGTIIVPMTLGLAALDGGMGFAVGLVGVVVWIAALAHYYGSGWIIWPFLIMGGTVALWGELHVLSLGMILALGISELLRRRLGRYPARDYLRNGGWSLLLGGIVFVLLTKAWTTPTGQFMGGTPAWLGSPDLVIPAIVFWGFPWVGTISVLIYLSGLQQIDPDVYDAARIDGVGPVGMFFRVELPLIMTQVRINLVFLTITTLTGYEVFLILLGPEGGPDNRGLVPGLYMFQRAFKEGRFGYACALGMVLFAIVLLLTVVYNRYVRVER